MKSQVSTEFMTMVMAATLMIIVFMVVFSEVYQDNLSDKKRILAEDYGYSLQTEFILAAEAKHGYLRLFDIPYKLEGFEYEVEILDKSYLELNYTDATIIFPIPETEGQPHKGINNLRKINNTICINC